MPNVVGMIFKRHPPIQTLKPSLLLRKSGMAYSSAVYHPG